MVDTSKSEQIISSLAELGNVARELRNAAGEIKIWLFYGDLGAGKTTLIQEIGKQLGVKQEQISSPTFSLINEYASAQQTVFHFDLYRLKNESEVLDLGIEEYLDSDSFCFIEWPDRLGKFLPEKYFKITLTHQSADTRLVQFELHG